MKKDKKKSAAITQQNITKSREAIIAKGKKFRYPFQYSKHKLVINTILISVVALIIFGVVGWVRLYKAQSTSDVMYRFTKAFAVPVAEIDGVKVRYSDYLMLYRASIQSIERQQGTLDNSDDSNLLRGYYKRQSLTNAEEFSYAMAKLKESNNSVTDAEIDEVINDHKTIGGEKRSDSAFESIIRNNLGLDMSEYRQYVRLSVAKKKYSETIDERAKKLADEIAEKLKTEKDFKKVAEEYKNNDIFSMESLSQLVDAGNLDSGRAEMAASLNEVGDVSDRFLSENGDGFYFVKLTDRKDGKVKYDSIRVRFTRFDEVMEQIKKDGKIKEFIELDTDDNSQSDSEEKEAAKN